MRAKTAIPTSEQIDALVKSGNLGELQALNEVIAKRANQRFKELEKHDMQTASYNIAKYYLQNESELSSGETFSRKKTNDIDALGEDLKQASKFLRSQTSTVSGEKKRRKKIFHSLTKKGGALKIPENIKVPADFKGSRNEYFQNKFLEFLDNDVWNDIKKYIGGGGTDPITTVLQEAGEAIAKGAQIKDLEEAYYSYLEGEQDIFTVWDDWIKVD